MARTRNQSRTAEPATVTVNAMDKIVNKLNTIDIFPISFRDFAEKK